MPCDTLDVMRLTGERPFVHQWELGVQRDYLLALALQKPATPAWHKQMKQNSKGNANWKNMKCNNIM